MKPQVVSHSKSHKQIKSKKNHGNFDVEADLVENPESPASVVALPPSEVRKSMKAGLRNSSARKPRISAIQNNTSPSRYNSNQFNLTNQKIHEGRIGQLTSEGRGRP